MPSKQKPLMQPVLASFVKHNNQRLFSDYFLDKLLPKEEAWQALSAEVEPVMSALQERFARFATHANESQTERDWIQPVLEALGHTFEVQARLKVPGGSQQPDYVFYTSEEQRLAAREHNLDDSAMQRGAIAIGDAKQWERPLDQMRRGASSDSFSNKNPSFQIFFYMLHSKLPWGILTNGRKWRLYHEATAYKLEVFYEVDLPDLLANNETEDFLYFYAFFRRFAFDRGHALSLERILAASIESSQKIRDNLREQVYDALCHVAQGFFDYRQNRLTPTPEIRRKIYENSLILLYRLLFILYAESRDLLPIDENVPYRNRYSLNAIKQQLHKALRNHELLLSTSGVIWAQLRTLFTSINEGNKLLNITTFDGGLFDPENADFLERYTVGDLSLAQAIDKLASTQDLQDLFIDYRDLSERHLGTIYEGLLEYTLHVASEPMAELRSSSAIVPLEKAAKADIAREYKIGEVYLITDAGGRKTTGSYYTPDYIVKYMVEQTLKPVLDEAVQGKTSDEERIQAVLAVNVLDPAMGSGHFPVEVVEYIARFLVELGVLPEGKAEYEADMTYWKRRVAQQCIYGVDMNRLAVELTKLSLWLATAAKGYPLNFLDHHLRPGNALIGVWLEDVATGEHPRAKLARLRGELSPELEAVEYAEEAVQSSMLENAEFSQHLSSALDLMKSIEVTPGNTISEVKQQEAAYAELCVLFVDKYERLMHLGTAQFYDLHVEPRVWSAVAEYAVIAADRPEASPFSEHYLQLLGQAYALGRSRGFFHWELEFPAIFFNSDGTLRGEQAGFDVVIGNPPYVRQEKLWEDKPFFQDHYEIYHGTADLFVYFFAQGLRLLRPGGHLAYISSNSWLRANYATALRRYLRTQTTVEQIIDLGNTRIFADAPDLSPAIQIVRRLPPSNGNQARVAIFSRSDRIAEFRELLSAGRFMEVSIHNQPDAGWQLKSDASRQLFTRLLAQGKPLGEVVEGRMYRGVLTGLNAAFIIDQATCDRLVKADAASRHLIKPLVRGEDLRPWYQEDEGRWLVCIPNGWTLATFPELESRETIAWEKFSVRYPALADYLMPFADAARKRQDKGQFWWELRPCDYYGAFEHAKIFFPDITKKPRFSWGEPGCFTGNTGYFIPAQSYDLLGILNSRLLWFVLTQMSQPLGERKGALIYRLFTQYMERLPIPDLTDEQCTHIGTLAQRLTEVARHRYGVGKEMMRFMKRELGAGQGKPTQRLEEWWNLSWQAFRDEVRKSFKREIPLRERGEWETLLQEQRNRIERFTAEIVGLEQELNIAVYAVFGLNEEESKLIEQETKYQYGEW